MEIKVVSLNCRGLNGTEKRRDVINFLRESDGDIFCLQDVHIPENQQVYFKTLWGGEVFFSSFWSDRRGVCIMFKSHLDISVSSTFRDAEGNLLIAQFTLLDKLVTLINIYGPNDDNPHFYNDLNAQLDNMLEGDMIIVCGDFNLVMDHGKDTRYYVAEHNKNAQMAVKNLIAQHDLVDVWRNFHPNERGYTWTRPEPFRQARLDMCFTSRDTLGQVTQCNIVPGYRTDHDRVVIHFIFGHERRGPGVWKIQHKLLERYRLCRAGTGVHNQDGQNVRGTHIFK